MPLGPAGERREVRHAHDVLRGIRRVKTILQLQEAYEGLLTFLRATREQVEAQSCVRSGGGSSSTSRHASKAFLHVPANPLLEAQTAVSQLKQVSLLCGAFCRRVEHVLRTTYTYADVDDTAHRGPAAVRVSACVAQLTEELQRFNTPAVNRLLAAATKTSGLPSASSSVSSPVDCVLSYGVGDLRDYRLCRRKRAQSYLQQLLVQPQWNTSAITQVIVTLSETLATPADTFALCAGDEAVQATCVVTPLRDPISQTVIRIPARGETCVHLELFDLESFVQATQQRAFTAVDAGAPCPLCSRTVHLATVRVDTRALEAMQCYERTPAAASLTTSLTTSPPPLALTADCALEWNTESKTVTVVFGRRGGSAEAGVVGEEPEEPTTPSLEAREAAQEAVAAKKRRIEIGGHVLYAD
ncbi:MIZ/SP-RING zinc finger containing protein [Novymonas esmeraldas]|uniref:MIZ/SP-RING zinc finger containing protein n=1 Tax=Novymonas esmeraldas TaxID=1808958 RepID=A0AAW0F3M1_9TRYP